MGALNYIIIFVQLALLVGVVALFVVKRSRYQNKSNAGAFFFENGSLVLNTGLPYPIPFEEIDCVELHYSARELNSKLSYGLGVKVIRKNGRKKWVYYKGYRTAKLATPFDMEAALKERGIRCVMIDT